MFPRAASALLWGLNAKIGAPARGNGNVAVIAPGVAGRTSPRLFAVLMWRVANVMPFVLGRARAVAFPHLTPTSPAQIDAAARLYGRKVPGKMLGPFRGISPQMKGYVIPSC